VDDAAEVAGAITEAAVKSLMQPVADLLTKIAGRPADELGRALGAIVGKYRFRKEFEFLLYVKKMAEQTGEKLNRVPDKILLPAIETGSLEDDPQLYEMWAALITNAAIRGDCRVAYAERLKQLSHDEANLLRWIFYGVYSEGPFEERVLNTSIHSTVERWKKMKKSTSEIEDRRLGVMSAKLVETLVRMDFLKEFEKQGKQDVRLTDFGFDFMLACEHPMHLRKMEIKREQQRNKGSLAATEKFLTWVLSEESWPLNQKRSSSEC
jgi:hypothetical protein